MAWMIARHRDSVVLELFDRAPTTVVRLRCADAGAKLRTAAVYATRMQCARYDRAL